MKIGVHASGLATFEPIVAWVPAFAGTSGLRGLGLTSRITAGPDPLRGRLWGAPRSEQGSVRPALR